MLVQVFGFLLTKASQSFRLKHCIYVWPPLGPTKIAQSSISPTSDNTDPHTIVPLAVMKDLLDPAIDLYSEFAKPRENFPVSQTFQLLISHG
jgi:hypothetical protein